MKHPDIAAGQRHGLQTLRRGAGGLLAVSMLVWLELADGLSGAHRWFHDQMLRRHAHPPHPDIVIVAIDERSLAALGRWPWSRAHHARLIDRLSAEAPRAIGVDILFTERDALRSADDQALSSALGRSGLVTLPVMMQLVDGIPRIAMPLPELERHAAHLGHVHLPVDSDGLVRRVFLREGTPARMWDHFTLAMLQPTAMAPLTTPTPRPERSGASTHPSPAAGWARSDLWPIAFNGPPGTFRRVSYVDVLQGNYPVGFFRDKLVLVGPTASGLGDMFATPVTHEEVLMPGVELHANVLDGLLQGRHLRLATPWWQTLFSLSILGLALLGLVRLGTLGLLMWSGLVAVLALGLSWLAFAQGLLISPLSGLLVMGLVYLGFVWRQWQLATHTLASALMQFRGSGGASAAEQGQRLAPGELLRLRIRSLRQMSQQLRDVHRFVRDSLEAVPDATLVCDEKGHILLANAAAARLAQALQVQPQSPLDDPLDRRNRPGDLLRGQPVSVLLQALHFPSGSAATAQALLLRLPEQSHSLDAASEAGRRYLIKTAPTHDANDAHTGWILSLVDVSAVHEAQRLRDEAIGFLSHDMRAPQSAILNLIELRRRQPDSLSAEQLEERVERHARKGLSLAEGFIHLASAQSKEYQLIECDVVDLLRESLDDAWETARQREIVLRFDEAGSEPQAWARVDRSMFGRAITNLLGNALKFSPSHSEVVAGVHRREAQWVVWVQDQGPGIDAQALPHLFTPFFRDASAHGTTGVGLGLPFVRTVMQRHGGQVQVHSQPGQGACFELWLPGRIIEPCPPLDGDLM